MSKATEGEGNLQSNCEEKRKTEWKPARDSYLGKMCCSSGGPVRHFERNRLGKMFMDARKTLREGRFRVK